MAPTGQATSWGDVLCCVRCNQLFSRKTPPVNLLCSHVICKTCVDDWDPPKCPIDETEPILDPKDYPINSSLLHIIDPSYEQDELLNAHIDDTSAEVLSQIESDLRYMSGYLHQAESERGGCVYSEQLSRPLQLKLVSLLCSQLLEDEGRAKALKTCRTMAERIISEVLNTHQSSSHVSTHLWTAVRARGCQFLGPAMQEDVLKLILLTLEKGALIARKTLVMYVVSMLADDYPQVSKTCVGHVVQLLYRASCFNVIKREGESSLMQLKEEFRNYEALRKEHDAQIVQMALEAGLRITPDQWSALLYGDQDHRSHMQSIIDKLQSPNSYSQGLEELTVMAESNPTVSEMLPLLDLFQTVHPNHLEKVSWERFEDCTSALRTLIDLQVKILAKRNEMRIREAVTDGMKRNGMRKLDGPNGNRYKTRMCREISSGQTCPRGGRCTYAHSMDELRAEPTTIQAGMGQMGMNLGQRNGNTMPMGGYTMMSYRKAIPHQPLMSTPHMGRPASGPRPPPPPMSMMVAMSPAIMAPPPTVPTPVPSGATTFVNGGTAPELTAPLVPGNLPQTVQGLVTTGPPPVGSILLSQSAGTTLVGQPPLAPAPGGVAPPPGTMIVHSPPNAITAPPGTMVMMPPPQNPMGPMVPPQAIWSSQPPAGGPPPPPAGAMIPPPGGPGPFWVQAPRPYNALVDGAMTAADWQQMKQEKVEADTEQLLLKRSEIINRLAPLAINDDEEDGDGGIGHVSYTVASSVLEDRYEFHHSGGIIMVGAAQGHPIELPPIPASFATSVSLPPAPTEETMNLIGENIAAISSAGNRPRTGSNPTSTSSPMMNTDAVVSATVQADCSSCTVKDVINQPLATPVIQMTAAHVVTMPAMPVVMVPAMSGAPMECGTVTYPNEICGAPLPTVVPPNIPTIRPPAVLPSNDPQDMVSTTLDKIVDVKERICEAEEAQAPSVVSEQLRVELRIAEREIESLDPRTQASCLLRELEYVDRELQNLHAIDVNRA